MTISERTLTHLAYLVVIIALLGLGYHEAHHQQAANTTARQVEKQSSKNIETAESRIVTRDKVTAVAVKTIRARAPHTPAQAVAVLNPTLPVPIATLPDSPSYVLPPLDIEALANQKLQLDTCTLELTTCTQDLEDTRKINAATTATATAWKQAATHKAGFLASVWRTTKTVGKYAAVAAIAYEIGRHRQ